MSENFPNDFVDFLVEPSRYRVSTDWKKGLVGWRIVLADDSWRELLNGNIEENFADFNICALPVAGASTIKMDDLEFLRDNDTQNTVIFEPRKQLESEVCIPRIKYSFSELSLKIELSLENISVFPIYWCPVIRVGLQLPWHKNSSLDQYTLCSRSKKRLTLNTDNVSLGSGKCPERLSLAGLEDNNILAITGIQDPKVAISTKNDEESVYVTLCGKYPNAHLGLRKTSDECCTELICMPNLPNTNAGDFSHHICVASKESAKFVIELSVF